MTVRSVRGRGCVYADICVYAPDAAYTPGREANGSCSPCPAAAARVRFFDRGLPCAYEPAGWDVDDSDFLVKDGDA